MIHRPVDGVDGMVDAAAEIARFGAAAVLVKGGHLEGADSVDVLWVAGEVHLLEGPRFPCRNTHGTGCTLSAAICARLALGDDLVTACRSAKQFVTGAIMAGPDIGAGVGPVDPGWSRRAR
jgi:hydroxymethylpyrimidine/phosphomethylpyrimidine kinase